MNLTDAYLVGSYTEFLVLVPYSAKAHEEKSLIRMRERALGEVKRILVSNRILANVALCLHQTGSTMINGPIRTLKNLFEVGFEYTRERNGLLSFRKRK